MFIDVLQMNDPKYNIGIYSKDKNPVKNRAYNNAAKRLAEFSKKFVAFLNKTIQHKYQLILIFLKIWRMMTVLAHIDQYLK